MAAQVLKKFLKPCDHVFRRSGSDYLAALEKVREWLAYVERESAAHIAQVEQQASKFGPQPGLPDDAVPTGQPTRDADQHSQHSVAVASAADADTQYSDDDDTETPLGGATWRRPRSQAASDVY